MTLVDDADGLDDEDRARLHVALEQAQDEIDRGEGIPAEEVLAELRKRGRSTFLPCGTRCAAESHGSELGAKAADR
jgi:hypothetical protein